MDHTWHFCNNILFNSEITTHSTMPSHKTSVSCQLCSKNIRIRLLGNHLENVHKIEKQNLDVFCKMQLSGLRKIEKSIRKKEKKMKKKIQKELSGSTRISEKSKLMEQFQKCLQSEYMNIDVFNKMLIDVSMEYHQKRLIKEASNTKEVNHYDSIDKTLNKTLNDSKQGSDLKLTINLKDRTVTKTPQPTTKKIESKIKAEKKTKTTSMTPRMTTSTPKPRKLIKKLTDSKLHGA